MLQSLTVPGWGQVTTGHMGAAKTFYLIETGIWVSFAAFEFQQSMRMESSVRTAQLFAGIDLHGRSDEYRRIVGSYPNSDEYNRLVVYRDAANLYFNDPAAYRAYIAAHEVTGSNALVVGRPRQLRALQRAAQEFAEGRAAGQHGAGPRARQPSGERDSRRQRQRTRAGKTRRAAARVDARSRAESSRHAVRPAHDLLSGGGMRLAIATVTAWIAVAAPGVVNAAGGTADSLDRKLAGRARHLRGAGIGGTVRTRRRGGGRVRPRVRQRRSPAPGGAL